MLPIQFLSVIGLLSAFVGALFLSVRIFTRIQSLQDITGEKINDQLEAIAAIHVKEKNASKTVKEIIEFLNLVFTDFESAQQDTIRRSRIGMAFLIFGTLLQGVALFMTMIKGCGSP